MPSVETSVQDAGRTRTPDRQEFLDLVVPTMETESRVLQPTVAKSSDEKCISIVEENVAKAAPPLRQESDE